MYESAMRFSKVGVIDIQKTGIHFHFKSQSMTNTLVLFGDYPGPPVLVQQQARDTKSNEEFGHQLMADGLNSLFSDSGLNDAVLESAIPVKDSLTVLSQSPIAPTSKIEKATTSQFYCGFLLSAICALILSLSTPVLAQQQAQPEVEQILVTGSFIRRSEGFQAASNVIQITGDELSAEGTMNMGEFVQDLSFNYGSSITNTTQGTSDRGTGFNLRGLGESSTLLLLDGMRTTSNNVNTIIPSIAIDRLEIVVDGASALYGSSAVAGVVNIIPYRSFEGFELEYIVEGDDRGDFQDSQISLMTGTSLFEDRVQAVFGAEFRNQGRLNRTERPEFIRSGVSSSTTSNPGGYVVPSRDSNGNLTGNSVTKPDPNCGAEREDPGLTGNNPNGFLWAGRCRFEFGDTRDFRNDMNKTNIFAGLSMAINPDLAFSGQVNFSRILANVPTSTSNPGGRTSELPVVRGEIPGNPFRAVDANGTPIFAQDANRDGLPDRDASNVVILDPAGIPFNEDVFLTGWRPLGKHGTQPSLLRNSAFPTETDEKIWRVSLKTDFTVPFARSWEGTAFTTIGQSLDDSRTNNQSFSAIRQGLLCDTVNDRDACFSPFVSTDPSTLNSQSVMDSIALFERVDNQTELRTFDVVFNGPVSLFGFELPGGEINAAMGYQRREEDVKQTPTPSQIQGDVFVGIQERPISNSQDVDSWFMEVAVPLLSDLSLEMAVRREEFSTGQSSTDPKFGLVYSPTNWLTLNGTVGDAFIAPTLIQLNAPQSCGLTNVEDPFTTFAAFTAECEQGNPNLTPESSTSKSFGFSLFPADGMSLSITWNNTDFSDRIIEASPTDVLNADYFQFQQFTGFNPANAAEKPSLDLVSRWVADPRSDKRIQRNPLNLAEILRIQSGATNASSMEVTATDVDFRYQFDVNNWNSTFTINLQASYIDSYEFQLSPEREIQEGVGNQNDTTGAVPAIPRIKANARLSWSMNNHNANLTVRYVDKMTFDANKNAFQADFPFSLYRDVTMINAWSQADASYSYTLDGMSSLFDNPLELTIGARNLFDRQAQKSPMNGGVIGELQDPLGRVIYLRANYTF